MQEQNPIDYRLSPLHPERQYGRRCRDVSFFQLHAEGAFLVSAKKSAGITRKVEIDAQKEALLEVKNPFGDKKFHLDLKSTSLIDKNTPLLRFKCQSGGIVRLIAEP